MAARHLLAAPSNLNPHLWCISHCVAFRRIWAGDPPDCVLLGDGPADASFSYGALNGSSSSFKQGLPLIGSSRPESALFPRRGELFARRRRLFFQTIECGRRYCRRWGWLNRSAGVLCGCGVDEAILRQHCLMVGDGIWRRMWIRAMGCWPWLAGLCKNRANYEQADQLRLPPST